MNVASLELSQRLYEVSGWDDTLCFWNIFKPYADGRSHVKADTYKHQSTDKHLPAYDLGFLLRKLQPSEPSTIRVYLQGAYTSWSAHRQDILSSAIEKENTDFFTADTPEDAAAKLCINLIESGIIIVDEKTRKETRTD